MFMLFKVLPRVKSIAKKRKDQSGEIGNLVTRSGYDTNARPVPPLKTSLTSTPSSLAKNPKTEKIANPATTEVRQLPKQMIIVSL